MVARVFLVLAVAFLGVMLGLAVAPSAPAVVAPAHPLRLAAARLDPPGVAAAQAALAFAGGERVTPVAAAPRRPVQMIAAPLPPPPAPPPPESVLRRSVAAVADEPGGLVLVLAGGGRRLRTGDSFMGWRVAAVTRAGAVLSRGGERREAAFFGPVERPLAPELARLPPSLSAGPPRPGQVAPTPAPPTAAEYFRGFKG